MKRIDVSTMAALQAYLAKNKLSLRLVRDASEWEARLAPAAMANDPETWTPTATGFGKTLLAAIKNAVNELETTVRDDFPNEFGSRRGGKGRGPRRTRGGGLVAAAKALKQAWR